MNKKIIALIVAAVLFLAGAILCTVVFATVGFDYKEIVVDGQLEEKTVEISVSDINSISLLDNNNQIKVIPSEDNMLHMVYYETKKEHYEITNEQGKLTIKHTSNMKWYDYVAWKMLFKNMAITLKVPKEFYGQLHLHTNNGVISVEDIKLKEDIIIENKNGKIDLSNVKADIIDISSKNGIINLTLAESNSIKASTNNGVISGRSVIIKNDILISTKNGNVSLASSELSLIHI